MKSAQLHNTLLICLLLYSAVVMPFHSTQHLPKLINDVPQVDQHAHKCHDRHDHQHSHQSDVAPHGLVADCDICALASLFDPVAIRTQSPSDAFFTHSTSFFDTTYYHSTIDPSYPPRAPPPAS